VVGVALLLTQPAEAGTRSLWRAASGAAVHHADIRARHAKRFELRTGRLARLLARAPAVVALPAPSGTFQRFALEPSPVLAPPYARRHPEIRTYSGTGIDDPTASIRADLTPLGFHASVVSARGAWYIDPRSRRSTRVYLTYDRNGLVDGHGSFVERHPLEPLGRGGARAGVAAAPGDDVSLRVYRLALLSDPSYATYFGAANVTAAKVTLVNRLTQIYERELGMRLQLVADSNLNLNTTAQATGVGGPCGPAACFTTAQLNTCGLSTVQRTRFVIGELISASNYDVGHLVLGRNGGGLAGLGVAGQSVKAMGCTGLPAPVGDGYAVDFVAHELGHQFGANHSFNGTVGNCAANRVAADSVEPGSGSSIMAYAGVCGSDDLQPHSDPYFAPRSREEILGYVEATKPDVQEIQTAVLFDFDTDGDQFRLVYNGNASEPIVRGGNYTAGGIQTALANIPGFPAGGGANVLSVDGTGEPDDEGFSLQFFGSLADVDVAPLSVGSFDGASGFMREIDNGGPPTNGGSSTIATGDKAPGVTAPAGVSIPIRTPFELTASGTDVNGDTLTYLWEQNDRGGAAGTALFSNAKTNGPLFRQFGTILHKPPYDPLQYDALGANSPTTSPTRVFPDLDQILAGNTNAKTGTCPASNVECFSEFLPTSGYVGVGGVNASPPRLNFRVTARDGHDGIGEGSTTLTLVPTAGPFLVTSHGMGERQDPGSDQVVTWNVAQTDQAPISVANVRISLSLDGGLTYPVDLAASTPNDGTQAVTLPSTTATAARIKVEALGNVFFDLSDANFPISLDTDPPETQIDSGPPLVTSDSTPTFMFSSEPGATFECRVTGPDWDACSSPYTTDPLADGPHTFEVRAKDAADNVDPTPDSRTFTVDTTGPVTTILAGPTVRTTNPFPTFKFTSEPNTLFTCSVDGVAVGCASPYETDRLSIGPHTFEVFGTDQVGNAGPPATRSFSYARPLQTRILSSPISNRSAKFRFTGSGGLAPLSFQCRLTGAQTTAAKRAWSVCQSPRTYRHLKRGSYTFWVRARDSEGIVDRTPGQLGFTIR
jgi:hypothetical protein